MTPSSFFNEERSMESHTEKLTSSKHYGNITIEKVLPIDGSPSELIR